MIVGKWLEFILNRANHTGTQDVSTITGITKPIPWEVVACSSEDNPLTPGTGKVVFRIAGDRTLLDVRASLTVAQTAGSLFTIDIKVNGVSIFSTLITFENTEKSSVTATVQKVLATVDFYDEDEVSIDIDTVGDGSAAGLKVYFKWAYL